MSASLRTPQKESGGEGSQPLSLGSPHPPGSPRRVRKNILTAVTAVLLSLILILGVLAASIWVRIDTFALEPPGTRADPQPVYLVVGTDEGIERGPGEAQYVAPGEEERPRADVVILLRMNEDGTATSVPIPRDLLVPREQRAPARLGMQLLEGPQALVDGVCVALGVPVNRYISINSTGFISAIDALGGLQMELSVGMRDPKANLELEAGAQNLTGVDALALVRTRHTQYHTDAGWVTEEEGAATRTRWGGAVLEQVRFQARSASPLVLARTAWHASEGLTVGGGFHSRELAKLARAQVHQVELPVEDVENARALTAGATAQRALAEAGFVTGCSPS